MNKNNIAVIYENKNYKITNENGYVKILKKNSGDDNIAIPYVALKIIIEKIVDYYCNYPENTETTRTVLNVRGLTVKEISGTIEMTLLPSPNAPIETTFRFDKTEFKNIVDRFLKTKYNESGVEDEL